MAGIPIPKPTPKSVAVENAWLFLLGVSDEPAGLFNETAILFDGAAVIGEPDKLNGAMRYG